MRCALALGLTLACGCSLDTRPLHATTDNSVTSETRDQSRLARAPSLPRGTEPNRPADAGVQPDAAADMGMVGTGKPAVDTSAARDAAEPMSGAPAQPPAASGGMSGAAPAGGSGGASASGSGGSAGAPSGGAPAPATDKEAVIEVLNERAAMNGTDALLVRSLVAQLDSPLPANAGTLRLLLTTALTSFGCPGQGSRECMTICNYVGDVCLTCVGDAQCREQLVLVCPNGLTGCLSVGGR